MKKKNTKGFTLVELMVVMAIMGILGTMLVMMMNAGGHIYSNANATMEEQSNARLAMSYITMRIRQNDVSNHIDVANVIVDSTSYSAITIIDSSNPNNTYWIYLDSVRKKLMEVNVTTGSTSTSITGAGIADISYFGIIRDLPNHTIEFRVKSADSTVDLDQKLNLRSE